MIEQLLRLAGVFAGDAVNALKDVEGAKGDVAEVADGSCDEVKAGCEWFVLRAHGILTMVGDCRDAKAGGKPLFAGFEMLDAPLLGEQRHGTHEVLHADDADDASALSNGNEGEAVSGGDAADRCAQRIFGFGYLEGT